MFLMGGVWMEQTTISAVIWLILSDVRAICQSSTQLSTMNSWNNFRFVMINLNVLPFYWGEKVHPMLIQQKKADFKTYIYRVSLSTQTLLFKYFWQLEWFLADATNVFIPTSSSTVLFFPIVLRDKSLRKTSELKAQVKANGNRSLI